MNSDQYEYIYAKIMSLKLREQRERATFRKSRDEDPTFFSTDPDPAQLEKYSGSGSNLKSK